MKVPQQPEINIGLVGHVDHGKTTLTEAFSGVWTDKHSEEIKRGISIRLGYADTAFYKCTSCDEPQCYGVDKTCKHCGGKCEFLRAVSFVDSPGHETLMATMLSGAALMDTALLLIAANEKCPQPQSKEHLRGLEISGIENIVIVQNKIDLVSDEEALENYNQIREFVKGTCAENAPIVPVSAHHDANLDMLIKAIEEYMPTPELDPAQPAKSYVARSFDVNKPGIRPEELTGGIIGGSLFQGILKVNDQLEIRPGLKIEVHGQAKYESITTEVISLISGGKTHKEVRPGGLIGIGTKLDPALTKSDTLTGNIAGVPGTLPPTWYKLKIETHLFESVVGADRDLNVEPIKTKEPLMLNAGAATTAGVVSTAQSETIELVLKLPICIDKGERVAISRRIEERWRLIGYGVIK
ncbi:MAG: translation initiation factor IF-2 subunit gamma [Thermoplasmata archaeon]|nr:translation initiation factor IF-2 subunit gamma [Thermoplasmata archaeon]